MNVCHQENEREKLQVAAVEMKMVEGMRDVQINKETVKAGLVYPVCHSCLRGNMVGIEGSVEYQGRVFQITGVECDYCEEREVSKVKLAPIQPL